MIHGVISALTTYFNHDELSRMRHPSAGNKAVNSIYLADFVSSYSHNLVPPDAYSSMKHRKSWIDNKYIKKKWYRESHLHVDNSGVGYFINKFCSFLHKDVNHTNVSAFDIDHRSERFSRDQFRNKRKKKKSTTEINITDKINRKRTNMKIRNTNQSICDQHSQLIQRDQKILAVNADERNFQGNVLAQNEIIQKEFKKIRCDDRALKLMKYPFNKVCADCATKVRHLSTE